MRHAVVLSILVAALGVATAEDPVVFGDPNLKSAVEEALGIADPTPTDMLGLSSLDAGERGIADISGIEYAVNLEELYLGSNQITDIGSGASSDLTSLTSLNLELPHLRPGPDDRRVDVRGIPRLPVARHSPPACLPAVDQPLSPLPPGSAAEVAAAAWGSFGVPCPKSLP